MIRKVNPARRRAAGRRTAANIRRLRKGSGKRTATQAVEPVTRPSLLAVLAFLKPLEAPFPAIEPLPAEPVEL